MNKISIIDYGMGNIKSVFRAVEKMGGKPIVTNDPAVVTESKKIILPGVGSYSFGMKELRKRKLDTAIHKAIKKNASLLGLCLGMQMLFEESNENEKTKGLDLIKGKVIKIPNERDNKNLRKIPHIGWNKVYSSNKMMWNSSILKDVEENEYFYFVHSYYVRPEKESDIVGFCEYLDLKIPSIVMKNKIFGIQYHPENSSDQGLKIYQNFISLS